VWSDVNRVWGSEEGNPHNMTVVREPSQGKSGSPGSTEKEARLNRWLEERQRSGPWDPVGKVKGERRQGDQV
jgi:hypothetical protein